MGNYHDALDRVAFSPDGALMATGGGTPVKEGSAFVMLWKITDPARPVEMSRFDLPIKAVTMLRFDGDRWTPKLVADDVDCRRTGPSSDVGPPRAPIGLSRRHVVTACSRLVADVAPTGGTSRPRVGYHPASVGN